MKKAVMAKPEPRVINSSIDITRQHLEDLLQESEERFRLLADATSVMIWMTDTDQLCTYFNSVWLEFTGCSLEQQLGKGWTQSIHPEDKRSHQDVYSAAFYARKKFQIEYRLRHADGEYRWVLDTGTPRFTANGDFVGYIGSCVDITERKQAEEKLRQKMAEQQVLLQVLPDLYFHLDSDGTIVDYNAKNPADLYVPPEMFLGQRMQAVLPPSVGEQFQTCLSQVLQTQTPLNINYCLPLENREGIFEATFVPLHDRQILMIVREITACVSAEAELRRVIEQLQKEIVHRVQVQEELTKQQQQQQIILDSVPAMIWFKDGENRTLRVNQTAATVMGLSVEEIEGKSVEEICPDEAAKYYQDDLEVIHSGLPKRGIIELLKTASGEKRWIQTDKIPWHDDDGNIAGVVVFAVDVTERQLAQMLLQDSLTRFNLVATASQEGLWDAWVVADEPINPNNPIQYSRRFRELLGYCESEFENSLGSWTSRIYPEDRDRVLVALTTHLKQKTPYHRIEHRILTKSGEYRWFSTSGQAIWDGDGKPVRMAGSLRDITTRKQAEAALHKSERRFHTLASVSPVGIYYTDAQGQVLYVNERWCEIAGLTPNQAAAEGWLQTIHPDDREQVFAQWDEAVQANLSFQSEHRFQRPDGKVTWVLAQAITELNEAGVVKGYVGTITDISDRKALEKELALRQARFNAFFASAPAGLMIMDDQLQFVHINETLAQMNGFDVADHLGRTLTQLLPELGQPLEPKFRRILATSEPILNLELSSESANQPGVKLYGMASFFPLMGEEGKPIGIGGVVIDITDRKALEKELALRQARFDAFFTNAPVGLEIIDDQMRFVYINDTLAEMDGCSVAEHLGKTITEIVPERASDLEALYEHILMTGESILNLEETGETPKEPGVQRHWISSRFPLLGENSEPIAVGGVTIEITKRKRTEEALKASEAQLRLAINAAQMGVWDWNLDTGLVTYSERQEAILGLAPNELDGSYKPYFKRVHPEDRSRVIQANLRTIEDGADYDIDYRIIWPDDTIHWIREKGAVLHDETGKAVRMIGITINITDRKQAEESLRHSEERYRKLAQQEELLYRIASQIRNSLNLDTILETAVAEIRNLLRIDRCLFIWYRLQSESVVWEVVHEAKPSELPSVLGCYPAQALDPLIQPLLNLEVLRIDDVQHLEGDATQNFLSLGYNSLLNLPIQTPSGEIGVVACVNCSSVRPWTDEEVELLCAVGDQLAIAINQAELYAQSRAAATVATEKATQLEQALHSLQQTQSQLIQTEKMSSLGQLVAGIAHEINNPVSFIYGNVDYANVYIKDLLNLLELYRTIYPQPLPEIEALSECIDLDFLLKDLPKVLYSMKMGADRIRDLVLSLRNFSRLDEADKKPVDIHEGLENTLLILQHRLKQQAGDPAIQVIKEYGQLPLVNCYPGQLNQVFMNLLTNAIDAVEQRRNEASPIQNPKIRISTQVNELGYITIRIADNGAGMTEAVLSRLFDPFFTTKPIGKGTGLGLSISYQIVVEKHKGTLRCYSDLSKGTEFVITLPQGEESCSDS
jgi:PAS domain S-box-containing protein